MKPVDTLLKILYEERGEKVPAIPEERKFGRFRALVNVRMPKEAKKEFLEAEKEYLAELLSARGVTDIADLAPLKDDLYLWQGDITTLKVGAIVNAANPSLLGCFVPNHLCIDNAIHTFAGVSLRAECARIMEKQGSPEPTGKAKITLGYNLPAKYVIHTVGPVVYGALNETHKKLLASSYESCLSVADERKIESVAFCCISTGEFRFPNEEAAKIAVDTVKEYKKRTGSKVKVVFNVFKDIDLKIYERLLG